MFRKIEIRKKKRKLNAFPVKLSWDRYLKYYDLGQYLHYLNDKDKIRVKEFKNVSRAILIRNSILKEKAF